MFARIHSVAFKASPIVLGTLLAACGGGGGSSSDSTPEETVSRLDPGGYVTTVTFEDGSTDEAATLLSPSGKFVSVLYIDDITVGTLSFGSDGSITGSGTDVFFDGSSWQSVDGTISGEVANSGKATLTVSASGVENGVVLEREDQLSDAGVTLAELTGTYSMSGSDVYTTAVTIAADGTITGSDETGCVFNGSATIPDTKYNVFEVTFVASNCTDSLRNGEFSGLGAYDEDLSELSFAGTDGEVTAVFIGTK